MEKLLNAFRKLAVSTTNLAEKNRARGSGVEEIKQPRIEAEKKSRRGSIFGMSFGPNDELKSPRSAAVEEEIKSSPRFKPRRGSIVGMFENKSPRDEQQQQQQEQQQQTEVKKLVVVQEDRKSPRAGEGLAPQPTPPRVQATPLNPRGSYGAAPSPLNPRGSGLSKSSSAIKSIPPAAAATTATTNASAAPPSSIATPSAAPPSGSSPAPAPTSPLKAVKLPGLAKAANEGPAGFSASTSKIPSLTKSSNAVPQAALRSSAPAVNSPLQGGRGLNLNGPRSQSSNLAGSGASIAVQPTPARSPTPPKQECCTECLQFVLATAGDFVASAASGGEEKFVCNDCVNGKTGKSQQQQPQSVPPLDFRASAGRGSQVETPVPVSPGRGRTSPRQPAAGRAGSSIAIAAAAASAAPIVSDKPNAVGRGGGRGSAPEWKAAVLPNKVKLDDKKPKFIGVCTASKNWEAVRKDCQISVQKGEVCLVIERCSSSWFLVSVDREGESFVGLIPTFVVSDFTPRMDDVNIGRGGGRGTIRGRKE